MNSNGTTTNEYARLDLDEDAIDNGGLSAEDQHRYEISMMRAAERESQPQRIALPISKFVTEGHFVTKTARAAWKSFDFVVKDLGIAVGPPTLLIAASYSGKSFLLQHLALCAVSNRKLLDLYDVKQGKVLHLDYEQGTDQSEVRYQRLMNGHGIAGSDVRESSLLFCRPSMMLDHEDAERELTYLARGYSLCIIDSYRAALGKMDENCNPLTSGV